MSTNLLNILDVASPCTASWEGMEGGEIVRFCSQCQLNVYNLSAMPAESAEAFLKEHEGQGRTCVRFYRRQDGTVITRDCPVGLAAVRAKVKRAVLGALTVAASLFAAAFTGCNRSAEAGSESPVSTMNRWTAPPQDPPFVVAGEMVLPKQPPVAMGKMCIPQKPLEIVPEYETKIGVEADVAAQAK